MQTPPIEFTTLRRGKNIFIYCGINPEFAKRRYGVQLVTACFSLRADAAEVETNQTQLHFRYYNIVFFLLSKKLAFGVGELIANSPITIFTMGGPWIYC